MHTNNGNEGFTLTELLVVMSVLAILGTVAVTTYIGSAKKAVRSEAYSNLESLRMFQEQRFAERGQYSANLSDFQGFTPGAGAQYTYNLSIDSALSPPVAIPYDGATVSQTDCFVATATARPGTRADGDVFAIDCNNNKNF